METMKKEHAAAPADAAETGRRKGIVITAIVSAAIIAILLVPCVLAASSTTIYPRTTVAGINVGGMSRSEAVDVLTAQLPDAFSGQSLPITIQSGDAGEESAGGAFSLSLADLDVTASPVQAAEAAYENGRSGNFFTSGIAYAKGLLLGHAVAPELTFNRSAARAEIAAIAAQADIPITECSWRIEGDNMIVTKPKSGYLIDQRALLEQVETAIGLYDLRGVQCPLEETAPAAVTMDEIYGDAHSEATNAYYDKASGTVRDGDPGVDFDPVQAQALMDEAAPGEDFSVPVTITEPKISKEEMSANLFRDKLGSCTTTVTGTANRKHNVALAARSCNGVVLNPGETFSYNDTLGQRTAANGYRTAAAYVGGKTVQEYGGGICQISSTVYLATLRANLEITDRTNHMFYPGYIPYGMDATVSWGGPDFKFRNNTDYPIKLVVTYSGGKATCTIYGTNTTGNSVKMEYSILSSTPYQTVEQEDSSLAPGERRQQQNGYTGYKVATYRCIYDADGNLVSRTFEANSTYRSRNQIILVGPEKEEEAPPAVQEPVEDPSTPVQPPQETDPAAPQDPGQETPQESQQAANPADSGAPAA